VVQLYLRDVVSTVTRPVKELKGFSRVALKPGETKAVTFPLGATPSASGRRRATSSSNRAAST
jgi:hypothetical protein